MGAILDAFRSSRLLQFGVPAALLVIIIVVVVAVSGVFGGPGGGSGGGEALGENQQLVTVRLETIEAEIPINGSLIFPNKASLTFDSRGIVGDINVDVGQVVTKGQILASFDALAVADLETKIAEERINVQNAQNIVDALRIPNPVSVAKAESFAAEAELRLDNVKEAFEDLVAPDAIIVSRAEQALANAEKSLDDALEALDDLINPLEVDVTDAENRVANAKVEIDEAQEAFDDIRDGAFPLEEIRDARNALNFANTELLNAQRTLSDARLESGNRIRTAQNLFDEESENYHDIFQNFLGIGLTEEEMKDDPDTLFELWGVDLNELFDRKNPIYTTGTPPKDDPETRWNELRIWAWLNLYPSPRELTGKCDDNAPVIGNNCISRQFDDIFDVYDSARDGLQTAQDQGAKAIESAQDGVTAAEDRVADAQEDFDEIVVEGPDLSEIESAETRLAMAFAALKDAEEDLDELLNPKQVDIAKREKDVAVARASVEEAQEDLDEVLNPDPIDVADLEKSVSLAESNLEEAKVKVVSARRSHELDVELAQSNVKLAQEGLNESIEDRDGAFIKAPFNGVVALINVEIDDEVNDESRILEIVDPSVIEVDGVIDAASIGSVREGSLARVTVKGLGGRILDGMVTFVAPEPITESGVVSFPIIVRANVPTDVEVPVTLNAVAAVIVGEAATSLLVPQNAIQRGVGGPMVRVMNGEGLIERRNVVLGGTTSDNWRIVRSGLAAGDQVVTSNESVINQGNGTGGSGGGQS